MFRSLLFYLFLSAFILINTTALSAQDKKPRENEVTYRFFTGGNLGLGLGTVTNIDVSPMLGINVTNFWSVGCGLTYQYYRDNRFGPLADPIRLDILGARFFTRLLPIEQVFGHLEYEYLSYKTNLYLFPGIDPDERINSSNLLVGAGYRQRLGINTYSYIMVLWNLNETIYTPYSNPVFRVGIEMGFN